MKIFWRKPTAQKVSSSFPRRTLRDTVREEIEKEEETSQFKLDKKVNTGWARLGDWQPGLSRNLKLDCCYDFVIPLILTSTATSPGCTTSRWSKPATGGDGVKPQEGHVSVSEDEADCAETGDKVFRQLGFPQIESSKFNPSDFCKVAKCLTKRSSKLQEMVTSLKAVESPSSQQQAFLGTNDKWLINSCFHFALNFFDFGKPTAFLELRLMTKLEDFIEKLNTIEGAIMTNYTTGIVSGFKKEPQTWKCNVC